MSGIGILIGLFLIIYGIRADKGEITVIGGALLIITIAFLIYYARTGHVAKNNNDETWIKPEKSPEPKHLPKGKKASNIDGVATQKGVFKVPNATRVKIDENGNIEFTAGSKLTNKILALKGGYKDADFVAQNPNWKPLWDKYNELKV